MTLHRSTSKRHEKMAQVSPLPIEGTEPGMYRPMRPEEMQAVARGLAVAMEMTVEDMNRSFDINRAQIAKAVQDLVGFAQRLESLAAEMASYQGK